ncbi:hypothetical protein GCM10010129_71760 [Streptomyces fumigatiscleroticus]|nr:hypothetical protein GCM10010129_71760 [Streptomyces fumigatiscleroticus]
MKGQLYSVLSGKPGTAREVAGGTCAVCRTAPAAVLDHCHGHGYVRAPFSELPVPSVLRTDPVLGQPPEQLLAGGLDKAPSRGTGIVGDLCHAFGRWHEYLKLLGLVRVLAWRRSRVLVLVVGGCLWTRSFDVSGSARSAGVGWHGAPLGQSEIGHIE